MKSMEFEKVGEERGVSGVSGFQEAGKLGKKGIFDLIAPTTLAGLSTKMVNKEKGRLDKRKKESSSSSSDLDIRAGPYLFKGECSKTFCQESQGPTSKSQDMERPNPSSGSNGISGYYEVGDGAPYNTYQGQQIDQNSCEN
ncbi:hypothetical protein QYF36_017007 [Acer negundo]|nr:hypothetical protein QYF36_017007 [Acer negundo]